MFSVTNILCRRDTGNERLRYRDLSADAPPKPVVVWAVTRACNLRCVHCYAAAGAEPDPGELSHDEGRTLLEDLKAYGVPAVLISGGEPLARPDTLDLMAYARQLGLNLTLSTNGLLITDAVAGRLADMGVRYVGISLDGMRRTHDKLRGMAGAFDQTLAAIGRCQRAGLKVGLRFTIHALNLDELDPIFDLCLDHGIDRLCVYHLAYAGRGGRMQKADLTAPQTRDAVERIFERARAADADGRGLEVLTVGNHADAAYALLRLEQEPPGVLEAAHARLARNGGNGSGSFIASVDPVGNVHYDQFSWHYTCGNVRHATFAEVWGQATDPRLATLRRRRDKLPRRCRDCRFLDVCNGNLRTRAEAATGDWLGDDPSCYLTDAEIAEPVAVEAV